MDGERVMATLTSGARWSAAVAIFGVVGVLGCTDTEIVFRDREVYNPPADATNGFLGYYDQETQLTTCGNCHVEKQAGWETTGHNTAWEDLQNSGHASETCEGCHTVNENGNALTEAAGYNLVADSAYHDVQCESCHGPGLDHVMNPDVSAPFASLKAGLDLGTGCGDCHAGAHHPFVDQWEQSAHGSPGALSYAGTREPCNQCHEGKTALAVKFGEVDDYLEKDDPTPLPITCAVCHDPHGSPNENNLRAPINVASREHLCVTCHSRSATPPSSHGPHSPQGLLVLGVSAGWIPPDFQYDTTKIAGTHGTEANPKLCATCHVNQFEVSDPNSGDFLFSSKGHTFEAIPCLDANGVPVEGPCPDTERDFSACVNSGCHGSQDVARTLIGVVEGRLHNLLDQLWYDTNGDHVMDVGDAGLLPQVVAQGDTLQLNVEDDLITVAEGALWNAQLAHTAARPWWADGEAFGIHFSAHRGSGRGVHNPFLLEALLTASINAVKDKYNLAPPIGLDLTVHATPPPGMSQ